MGVLSWMKREPKSAPQRSVPTRRTVRRMADRYSLPASARVEIRQLAESIQMERDIAEAATSSNLWHGWGTTPQSINRSVWEALKAIRARSRERGLSDPLARRYVQLAKQNVVGPNGPKLNSMPLNPDGTRDEFAARVVEEHWRNWCQKGVCDAAGRLSFRGVCETALADVIYDGEALIRRRKAGPHGLELEFVDAERLDFRLNKIYDDGSSVVMGVELDPDRKPVALHLLSSAPTENITGGYVRVIAERVPIEEVLHIYVSERSGQVRGIPWLISVIARMKMLHGYIKDAERAARVGASSHLFYKTESGMEAGIGGATEAADGSLEMDLDEVGAQQIGVDEDVIGIDPAYPHAQFDPFIKAMNRIIAVGVNVSYHSLSGDLEGVNYSSIRQGVLDDREAWMAMQNWLFESLCTPVFHWWLEAALDNGVLTFTKGGQPQRLRSDFDKLRRHSWRAKRWPWVDPLKDMTANKMAIELGVRTVSQVIEDEGNDADEVWERRATEIARMDALGIPSTVAGTEVTVNANEDPDEDENDGS